MDTLVFILAAGLMGEDSYSWRSETPRHLLPIAGEPLIRRTLRLVRRFGYDAITVTKSQHIKDLVKRVLEPENDHLIYDTMLSTRHLWVVADRVVFLQGDFLFCEDFLAKLFGYPDTCVYEADHGPPGVIFMRRDYDRCEAGLRHLSQIHVLHQDLMQALKGFIPKVPRYGERPMYDFDNIRIWELCLREQPWVKERPKPVLFFPAAGRAKRLSPVSDEMPKALLEFGGQTLAEWMVDEFVKRGIGEVIVSVGHHREQVERCLGTQRAGVPVSYVYNPDYENTGSGVSVTLAREHLHGRECYIFEGDQILDPELIRLLVESPHLDCMLVDEEPDPGRDPGVAAVGTQDGLVQGIVWPAHKIERRRDLIGNAPYVLKLSRGATEIFTQIEDDGCVESLEAVVHRLPMYYIPTGDLAWAHINTEKGLDYARTVAFPKIQRPTKTKT